MNFNEMFEYKDGRLFWKIKPRKGIEAGSETDKRGYRRISYKGKRYKTHRLIWEMFNNRKPEGLIDHIDGNVRNNNINNLRLVTPQDNQRNTKLNSRNTSGIVGVTFDKRDRRWRAAIKVKGRKINIGSYYQKMDAIFARMDAEEKYGFHKNHGKR